MKKSIKIFPVLFLFVSLLTSQVSIAQISNLELRSSLSATDNLLINVPGVDDYKTTLEIFKAWLFQNGYFTNELTIPSSLSASLVNGIGFNLGEFAWSDGNGDSLFYGASKAYVAALLEAEGIAGDLSAYATKAGNNAMSGQNTFSNLNDFRTGSLYFPYKTSYTASIGNSGGFNYSDGTMIFQTKDASNNKYDLVMADRAWVTANFSQVTGFIKSTGTQTGVNSLITLSGGYFNFASAALIIGENTPTYTGQLTYDLDQGESGLHVKLASGELYVPDDVEVADMIDAKINLSPTTMVSSAINLASANRFIYDGNDDVTFTISNIKQTSFELFISTQGITIAVTAPSGYTIEWLGDAIEQPSDQGDYKYIFEVWGTVIKAYLAYRD